MSVLTNLAGKQNKTDDWQSILINCFKCGKLFRDKHLLMNDTIYGFNKVFDYRSFCNDIFRI